MIQRLGLASLATGISLLILVSAAGPLLAAGQIIITSDEVTATGETVTVTCSPVLEGSCATETAFCNLVRSTITVTPCPPGAPCDAQGYTFTLGVGASTSFTLQLGTLYSFSGSWRQDLAYTHINPCRYTCTNSGSLFSTQYLAANGTMYWELTTVSSDEATVVVDAVLKNFNTTLCPGAACGSQSANLTVTPCALDINGSGPSCNGTQSVIGAYFPFTVRVTLVKGQLYTFGGSARLVGLRRELSGACTELECEWNGQCAPVQFGGTVATQPATWGHVKAMYRSP